MKWKIQPGICLKVTSISFPSSLPCLDKEISDEEESGDGDSEGLGLEESDEDAMDAAEEQECGDDGDNSLAWRKGNRSRSGKTPGFTIQNISDFEKFTEGMDDLGSSDDEEDEEEESGMEEGDGEEDLEGASEEDRAEDRNSEDDGVVMTFSSVKVSEEVEKGRAVKNQIGLYMVCCLLIFQCLHLMSFLFVFGCSLSPVSSN